MVLLTVSIVSQLAIQNGATLLPSFVFGQHAAYRVEHRQIPFISQERMQRLWRLIGFELLKYWVRCYCDQAYQIEWYGTLSVIVFMVVQGVAGTDLPFRHPMTVVFGGPIPTRKKEAPKEEENESYLQPYKEETERQNEKYKGQPEQKIKTLVVL